TSMVSPAWRRSPAIPTARMGEPAGQMIRRGRSLTVRGPPAREGSASIPPSFLRTTIPPGFSPAWATWSGLGRPIPTSTISVPSSLTDPEAPTEIPTSEMPTRSRSFIAARRRHSGVVQRTLAIAVSAFASVWVLAASATPAAADFRLCNNTSSRVGIAIGYKDKDGWTTEGWWNLASRSCETLLRGTLVARFYYIYAVDYDRGGEWSGQAFMCTRDKEFTVRGTEDCLARGFDRTGFFEVDTGEQQSWTVQLTDANEQARPLVPNQPMLPIPPASQQPPPTPQQAPGGSSR